MILLHRLGEILARPVKAFAEIRLHPATHRAMMGESATREREIRAGKAARRKAARRKIKERSIHGEKA
ncbi:hypothetical protein [uncultured Gemmiger sp.]|uniref:hypothetical protein n=1 Tax=uncultured Gemmiger sp. TaxID=1623490 RepID=UPI00266FD108|nr:hypothetical protein [uncultured Gemmiger sp.]